jgi:hypothetical protein
MERLKWTDSLIDERMATMDKSLDRLSEEIHALRDEMRSGFASLRDEVAEVRRDVFTAQRQMTLIMAGFAVGLLGLLGAGQF